MSEMTERAAEGKAREVARHCLSEASLRGWFGRGGQRGTGDLTRPWVAVLIGQYSIFSLLAPKSPSRSD